RPPRAPPFPYTTLFRSHAIVSLSRISEQVEERRLGQGCLTPGSVESVLGVLGSRSRTHWLTPRTAADETAHRVGARAWRPSTSRSEEHTSELQSLRHLV